MDILQLARDVYHSARELSYEQLLEKYEYFVKQFPIVTKYMTYGHFHEKYFQELVELKTNSKLRFEETFEAQTNYVKHMLVDSGVSKMEAKKISQMELGEIQTQVNKIKKQEQKIKQKLQVEKQQNETELKREFKEFVTQMEPQASDDFIIINSQDLVKNWGEFINANLRVYFVEIDGNYRAVGDNAIFMDDGNVAENIDITLPMLQRQIFAGEITSVIFVKCDTLDLNL
jgi:acetolactate synthase small subunit